MKKKSKGIGFANPNFRIYGYMDPKFKNVPGPFGTKARLIGPLYSKNRKFTRRLRA